MLYDRDIGARKVFVRLEPLGQRTREKVRRYTDNPDSDGGIQTTTRYQVSAARPEHEDRAIAAQDSAMLALRMAREALGLQQPAPEQFEA